MGPLLSAPPIAGLFFGFFQKTQAQKNSTSEKTQGHFFAKQVKPGFTNYQPHPKYSWALRKIEGKGEDLEN